MTATKAPQGGTSGSPQRGGPSSSGSPRRGGSSTASPRRGEVRIIGGAWKRSKLPVADVGGLRPTPDRVRETLFNWLGQDLSGWRCVDAYAGSGALGFEAASRGAAEVVLLERDRLLVRQLAAIKERLHAERVRVQAADALGWLRRGEPRSCELVFLDPPFGAGVLADAMLAASALLVDGGYLYAEGPAPLSTDDAAACGCELHRQARAGSVHFHLLQRRYTAAVPANPPQESAA